MLADLAVTMPRAAIDATNQTIYQLWGAEKTQMIADIDRPVSYSVNSILYERMNAEGKGGKVWLKDIFRGSGADETNYLGVQMHGGTRRRLKASEIALQKNNFMPSGMVWVPDKSVALDSHGNVSGNVIKKMLADLKGGPPHNFYVRRRNGTPIGVFTKVGDEWYPFLWFVSPRQYRERFDFYGRADKEVEYAFGDIYAKAIQKELDRHR